MHIREVAPTELACCMRSCVRPVRLMQSWLLRKRARSQRCSFESPSVAYGSPEHCQSTKHGHTSNRTTSQKIKVRVYPITCPLCKGLVTSERMGGTVDVTECETWAQYHVRPDPVSRNSNSYAVCDNSIPICVEKFLRINIIFVRDYLMFIQKQTD